LRPELGDVEAGLAPRERLRVPGGRSARGLLLLGPLRGERGQRSEQPENREREALEARASAAERRAQRGEAERSRTVVSGFATHRLASLGSCVFRLAFPCS